VTTSLEADELGVAMITCESAQNPEFGRLINWGVAPFQTHTEAAPWPIAKAPRGQGGWKKILNPPNPERGGGRVVLKMSICIVVEVPNAQWSWNSGRPNWRIAGNKAQNARNSEEIPLELAAFPGKPLPKPPGHLKAAGRRLWTDIVTQYRIADGAGLALVTTAAEALDRIREAQAAIRKHGALVADRYGGVKQNPACFLERDARAGMLSALRALNLDLEPLRDRGRPTVFDRK